MVASNEKGPCVGMRHVQAFLIFLVIVVIYISRYNDAVAVVAMTNAATSNPNFPEFDWTEKQKSYILSSFYWGYIFTQFVGSFLSRRFGSKYVIFFSILLSAVFSVITPFCLPWGGWQIFCAIRIIQGLFQGMIFPSVHLHLSNWSPKEERNLLGTISHTGMEFGMVLAIGLSGIIAEGPWGWPGISYVSGVMSFIVCFLWLIFAANNPPKSRFISTEECQYIELSLERSDDFHQKKIPIPWRAILTSVPVNAFLFTRCCQAWGFSTMQAEIPSYMHGVLHMNIKTNALYSALPWLAMWVLNYVNLFAANMVLSRQLMSLTNMRKTFNTIALVIPAMGMIGIGFLDDSNKALAIVLCTFIVGINSGNTIGSLLNTIDLSPNHAVILMGIMNTVANIIPLIVPLVVGVVVTDVSDRTQWQIIFAIAAVIYVVGSIAFIKWGSAEAQPWDAEDYMALQEGKKRKSQNEKSNDLVYLEDNKTS